VSFIGVSAEQAEIFRRAQLAAAADFKPIEAYLLAAGMYWFLTAVFTFFQSRLERRISKGYVRGAAAPAPKKTAITSLSGQGGQGGDLPMVVEVDDQPIGPEVKGQGH
jgi:polar amino acid transport system permease protein